MNACVHVAQLPPRGPLAVVKLKGGAMLAAEKSRTRKQLGENNGLGYVDV